jgi:hypothetical protein
VSDAISLSSKIGEVMAPQTLVTALTVDLDGRVRLDAGALHGRSELESGFTWVARRDQVSQPQTCWIVWVAIELDAAERPVRYKGLAVCELAVDPQTCAAHKSLAEHINRISDAMRGSVAVSTLPAPIRQGVREQLQALDASVWQAAPDPLRSALT